MGSSDFTGRSPATTTPCDLGVPNKLLTKEQFVFSLEVLNGPTIWLAKTALLLQLMHIFAPTKSGRLYWIIHALIWGNLIFYTGIFFSQVFQCVPREKIWDRPAMPGHCININAMFLVTGSVNVLSDILILVLPLWATWRLQMDLKHKAGIMAVFGTGFL